MPPKVRSLLFWAHLATGVAAGLLVLVMSTTGVLLAYERQIVAWVEDYVVEPASGAARLGVDALLERARVASGETPSAVTLSADRNAPAVVAIGRERNVFLDPYSGAVLGEGSPGLRRFFRTVTDWHRWLGAQAAHRDTARAFTGAANLGFLFLVTSGFFLWWPRQWSRQHLRPVAWFQGGLEGRARDFNWHNVLGLWSALPLFFIVSTGVVMSYPWANDLLYRLAGSTPPPRSTGPRASTGPPNRSFEGLDALLAKAGEQAPGWRTLTLRVPSGPDGPVSVSADRSHRGRPDLRVQVTLQPTTGEIAKLETFSGYDLGRRLRTWARWIHTGEAGGVAGQALAGTASAGATVLVWTGLALAWRRFFGRAEATVTSPLPASACSEGARPATPRPA